MTFPDNFKGENSALLEATKALIELDAAGALVPHGLCGHARVLLNALASRLATRDGAVERIEHEITAWAFANDVDGAVRNDLLRRVRALLAEPAAEGEGK